LFEFPHENAGLEALHVHGESKQLEVRLPLAFSKLSKQNSCQKIERMIRIVADIQGVQNVPEDLLEQVGESIGVFEFLLSDARSCELALDEPEPNMRFLLIIRIKFHLGSYCRSYGLNQIVQGHVQKVGKNWQSPKMCRGLVPRRAKYGSHY
jgi:hypothetical protein